MRISHMMVPITYGFTKTDEIGTIPRYIYIYIYVCVYIVTLTT